MNKVQASQKEPDAPTTNTIQLYGKVNSTDNVLPVCYVPAYRQLLDKLGRSYLTPASDAGLPSIEVEGKKLIYLITNSESEKKCLQDRINKIKTSGCQQISHSRLFAERLAELQSMEPKKANREISQHFESFCNDPYPYLPQALKDQKHWAVCKTASKKSDNIVMAFDAKPIKLDGTSNLQFAEHDKEETLSSYRTACEVVQKIPAFKLSFMLQTEKELDRTVTAIYLERCATVDQSPNKLAQRILEHFPNSYCEYWADGDGFLLLTKGKMPLIEQSNRKKDGLNIKVYSSSVGRHHIQLSGEPISPEHCSLSSGQAGLAWLYADFFSYYDPTEHGKDLPVGASLESILEAIPADDEPVKYLIGLMLKSNGQSLATFDSYCQRAESYSAQAVRTQWEGLPTIDIHLGFLYYIARKNFSYEYGTPPEPVPESIDRFPILEEDALHGLAGKIVKASCEDSEAHPAAVLLTLLTRFGVSVGNGCYKYVGDTEHSARLYCAIVGQTSRARKGTSAGPIDRIFSQAKKLGASVVKITPGPLGSGEGLIHATRDPSEATDKEGKPLDPGIADKRIYVQEGELAGSLTCAGRDGNILSVVLRTGWELQQDGTIAPLIKHNPEQTTGMHLGIVGHITIRDLQSKLKPTDISNGGANRFVYALVRRTKAVANPRPLPIDVVSKLAKEIKQALDAAQSNEIDFDEETLQYWSNHVYEELTRDEEPDVVTDVTCRAEAQVIRFALIYALLDCCKQIRMAHLKAALALWKYCQVSAEIVFGSSMTKNGFTKDEQKIISALNKKRTMTLSDMSTLFSNRNSGRRDKALADLKARQEISSSVLKSGATVFTLRKVASERKEISSDDD